MASGSSKPSEVPVSNAKRAKSSNADLVVAARAHADQILKFHDHLDDTESIILHDVKKQRLHSNHLEEYKATLRPESQGMLDEEFERAAAKSKVLVVVWDSATRRLATTRIRRT
jgi:hypothetical protein